MQSIVFYISSHGFGHSTRAMEVIANIPDHVGVAIVTAAPEWLFRHYLKRSFEYRKLDHDCGVVQPDSLGIDASATRKRWEALLENYPQMAQDERAFLAEQNACLIVGDISPFAVAVAQAAELPCTIIANFCWNWIFEEYLDDDSKFAPIIEAISNYYNKTDCLLRTPLSGDLSVFPRILDIPMIVRTAKKSRQDMRKEWGVSDEQPVALLSFGGLGVNGVKPETLSRYPHWKFLTFDAIFKGVANAVYLDPQAIYHPDLVNAADLVIAKLGYGLNTECIAHQTPMAYVPRDGFREYGVLEQQTALQLPMLKIETDLFFQGNWDTIDDFFAACSMRNSLSGSLLACNGGEIAAQWMTEQIDEVSGRVVQSA
ncbi:MAG: hypothetical protein P9L94_01640 [Candidatus Hinthialibacter antarcticus]|nr:hypothetical protein [Candidatus Hinthialibacter antarcticus]